jgi:arginine/lysine/ornithine decarboxylase
MCILLVSDKPSQEGAMGRAARALIEALRDQGVEVTVSADAEDGEAVIASDPHLQAVILDWDLPTPGGERGSAGAGVMLRDLRARNEAVPVFLLAERSDAAHLPEEVLARADEFIWLLEDTPAFIGERVVAAIERYRSGLLPPMFRALVKFAKEAEYSWHTPGHTGGTAFLRSPVGRIFHDYFGEALLRSDLSISVGELGSLLDHSGPIGDGEKYAAHVFGADRTYYVTNGTSTSNRVVMMGTVARDQLVVVDRNCHKSVEHGLSLTGALPVYLMPQRNHLGLIGPIPAAAFNPQAVARKIAARASSFAQKPERPALAVLTNSTYDGLCYDVTRVEQLLGSSVDRVLFDEAWFAYARFNPIYAGRHAMRGSPAEFDREGPTIFATQSTHKLLAALSQASMIHLREGRVRVDPLCFNEAFMMHASTSPQYAIIASNDVSAAMMDGNGGSRLTSEAIAEAVSFRQTLGRLHEEYRSRGDWFFNVWQPDEVRDGASRLRFHEAPTEMLQERQDCWLLEPGAAWHGFADLVPGYCMLDPIKVTVITPGIGPRGELAETGIPAPLLSAYLAEHGIVVEKTANFSILLLFSIGVTKGKWGSLISALMEFKRDYEANAPLIRVMPVLAAAHPAVYATQGLKDLAQAMFTTMCAEAMPQSLDAAFRDEPLPIFTPAQAYDRLVRGEASRSDLAGLASNIAATAIVPYPPGIPLLMPGEYFGKADGSVMRYLSSLRVFDRLFPGFGHDTHGIEAEAGEFYGLCLRN